MQQNNHANFKTASASSLPLSAPPWAWATSGCSLTAWASTAARRSADYFGFVALFGWVGLSGEFAFGRLTGTGPIGSYAYALRSRGKKGGGVLGAIPLLGSLGIAIGYAVIVGWVVRYCWGAVSGSLFAVGSEEYFGQITGAVRQPAVARRGGARHGAGPGARRAAGN